jgi:DNA (cytosine-5)-methyltransferase 1
MAWAADNLVPFSRPPKGSASSLSVSKRSIPVIDIFAGPGGLGEGFQQLGGDGERPFDVRLSIEKDAVACQTLKLRKFFHQFKEPPAEYHGYVKGAITLEQLYQAFPKQEARADQGAWHAELGKVAPQQVSKRVRAALIGARHWILLGGPPCQAYSIVGRARMLSTHENFEKDERHYLNREYLRIVANHAPSVFIFENVKGLLSSTQSGERVFTRILEDLRSPARALGVRAGTKFQYRLYALSPSADIDASQTPDFLVLSEQHGIPQSRHRIIVIGVRSDLPGTPNPLELQSTVDAGRVLDDLPEIRSRLSQEADSWNAWREAVSKIGCQRWMESKTNGLLEVTREIQAVLRRQKALEMNPGSLFQSYSRKPSALADWYRAGATGLSLHETRQHRRDDLHRYLFAACYLRVHERSPRIKDFPSELRPDHKNVKLAVKEGMFADRFRVQLSDRPSTTITSHIAKDGHYFIHYSAEQCRSLTVREAARLQTFPDSYFFCGGRTEQYHQVGNAVPPLLARQIAASILSLLPRRT